METALLSARGEQHARQQKLSLGQPFSLGSHSAVLGEHSDVPTLAITNQRSRPPSSLYIGRASPRGAPNVPFDEERRPGKGRTLSTGGLCGGAAGAGVPPGTPANYFGAPSTRRSQSLPRRSSSLKHAALDDTYASHASFRRLRALKQQEVDRDLLDSGGRWINCAWTAADEKFPHGASAREQQLADPVDRSGEGGSHSYVPDRTVVNAEVVGGRLCNNESSSMDVEDGEYAVLEVRVPARYLKLRRAR